MPLSLLRLAQIDAAEEKRELSVRELDRLRVRVGPREGAAFETLGEKPKSARFPNDDFQAIACTIGEEKEMTTERVVTERVRHERS
jgi:hypothetical protein